MRHGFLIDMDGVLYRGDDLIDGADEFVGQLRTRNIPFRFLTNNSQRTRRDVVARLARMGIDVEEEHIFTCAMATARFLAQQTPNGTAFVIGEGGLLTALHQNGYAVVDKEPDYVVVGEGRTFNLEQVEAAVRLVLGGAKLIATNLDPNCPTPAGLRPGCGAMVAMLEVATGIKAFSVGKPSPVMMRAARKELGLATDETTIIGDTMETDILGGVQLGLHTVLVLSGTGRQTLALAKELGSLVHAVDSHEPFLNDLVRRAREAKVEHLVQTHCMDMKDIPQVFQDIDLLWSEGAAYNVGFANALATWAPAMTRDGFAVISELSWLKEQAPDAVREFFRSGYPDMQSVQHNLAVAEQAGYKLLTTYTLPRQA
jgi:NagD protein